MLALAMQFSRDIARDVPWELNSVPDYSGME
jgi:hypothetical protein